MRRHDKTDWTPGPAHVERVAAAMAHRRGLRHSRLLRWLLVGGGLASSLAVALVVTVQVTALRESVAILADRQDCLAARNAGLQAAWVRATRPEVVRERARRELGLVVPEEPEFVLVARRSRPQSGPRLWRRVLEGLGGGASAHAATAVQVPVRATMISVQPLAGRETGAGS
jgi:cell division protein FtsB